jgi:large subunit ribosomal protein L15
MKVHDLAPAPGAVKKKTRVGRGIGGHGGKTAGRGTKGQHARNTVAVGFEGGQMPLKQRVPKLKGFNNPFRVEYQGVNLDTIAELGVAVVNPQVLQEMGIAHKGSLIKILGRGELSSSVQVSAHRFSKSAEAAITAAGGTVTLVPLPFKQGRPPAKGNQFTNR